MSLHTSQSERSVGPLHRLKSADGKVQRQLAEFVLHHTHEIPSFSISDFAKKARVSETTVVRFCKTLGYQGYRDFRIAMVENRGLLRGNQLLGSDIPTDIHKGEAIGPIAKKVVQINADVLVDTLNLLEDATLEEAINTLLSAGYVHFVGFGSSASVVLDAYQRLLRLGIKANVYWDPHIVAVVAANASPQDVFFGVSYSGETRDLVETFETAKERGARCVVMTSYPGSPVTQFADSVLISAVRRSSVPAETIASRISQLAIIDIICVGIALRNQEQGKLKDAEVQEREIAKKRLSSSSKRYTKRS